MFKGFLSAVLVFLVGGQLAAAGVFFDDETASAYDYDRVGKQASQVLLSVCGDQSPEQGQAVLRGLPGWGGVDEGMPTGVLLRERTAFAGEPGLRALFRVGRHSCTLTLSPYLPNERAGDELAYGVSEAAAEAYGDDETGWTPAQTMTGLHRIDAAGEQLEQTFFLQWLQRGGVPLKSYFAVFDTAPDHPRVILGRRDFNGRVVFGMADSTWERRRNNAGKAILAIQGKDPVDRGEGGFNTVAISRNLRGAVEIKAWLPIGTPRMPFRLQSSLGGDPLVGFARLTALLPEGGAMMTRELRASLDPQVRAGQAMLARGLYPVYLELDVTALSQLAQAEVFTLELKRRSGSEIHLQVPAGESLRRHLVEHLGLAPD